MYVLMTPKKSRSVIIVIIVTPDNNYLFRQVLEQLEREQVLGESIAHHSANQLL